jgi:hypothetical protein
MAKTSKPKTTSKQNTKTPKDGKAKGASISTDSGKFAAEIPPKVKTGGTKKK